MHTLGHLFLPAVSASIVASAIAVMALAYVSRN